MYSTSAWIVLSLAASRPAEKPEAAPVGVFGKDGQDDGDEQQDHQADLHSHRALLGARKASRQPVDAEKAEVARGVLLGWRSHRRATRIIKF